NGLDGRTVDVVAAGDVRKRLGAEKSWASRAEGRRCQVEGERGTHAAGAGQTSLAPFRGSGSGRNRPVEAAGSSEWPLLCRPSRMCLDLGLRIKQRDRGKT